MRITTNKLAYTLGALLLGSLGMGQAKAVSYTYAGSFTSDAQVNEYTISIPTAQTVDFFTTSYAGGTNLDGTTSPAGGFAPSVTIFSSSTGMVVDCGAGGITCSGMTMGSTQMDPATMQADDVNIFETLAAGTYVVALTENPNVAIGTLTDGFLTSVDSTLFTDACGGGMFLESDTAPCAQRNGKFALNVGTVPEPATLWLALPVLALGLIFRKGLAARS